MLLRLFLPVAITLLLSGCGGRIVPQGRPPQSAGGAAKPIANIPIQPKPAIVTAGPNARSVGAMTADAPGYDSASATRALQAFRISCPSLVRRNDQSGLTRPDDWRPACAAAASWRDDDAEGYFATNFEPVQIGDGKSFATGYFEPEIVGSRVQAPGYNVPVYRRPPDLIDVDLGLFSDDLKDRKIRGRVKGQSFVPYADRTEIEEGGLGGRGLEIAWAADPVEFFFLQVQGSGRARLDDGTEMRLGYAMQNGRPYVAIGRVLKDQGQLPPDQITMATIRGWLRAHPERRDALLNANPSYVFFQPGPDAGPVGAAGTVLTPGRSMAVDRAQIPLGSFLWLDCAHPDGGRLQRLTVAEDVGGAIKGPVRGDLFWGYGAAAEDLAGKMQSRGQLYLLWPRGGAPGGGADGG
mgnify:CR=1 FL=1